MKKIRKITVLTLCMATAITASSCGTRTDEPAVTTTPMTTSNTLDDDLINPVDMGEYVDETAEKLENPNLVYFGYYDMRTSGDIKPAVKLFEETYGGKIDYVQCAWAERIEKLQVLISSGDSPDLVDKEDTTFPLLISKNVYEDLSDYIDLSEPQWQGFDDLIEQHSWQGKHCYYPWFATALSDYIYYSRVKFDEYGITPPTELYANGDWTWDTMKQCMVDYVAAAGEGTIGIYGNVGKNIIATTGTPIIGIKDGKIQNNMKTVEVDRAMSFLSDLCREGLSVTGEGLWGNDVRPMAEGQTCFHAYGQYQLDTYMKRFSDIEIEFVPFPRDPAADEYYLPVSTFGYMVPTGSKNVKGAATFIDMIRTCSTDPVLMEEMKSSTITAKGWTEEQYDLMETYENLGNFNIVADFSTGFDSDTSTLIGDMISSITFQQDSESWAVLRDQNMNVIDVVIADLNGAE